MSNQKRNLKPGSTSWKKSLSSLALNKLAEKAKERRRHAIRVAASKAPAGSLGSAIR